MDAAEGCRSELRQTFDAAAELYDRVRPRYPAPMVDDLIGLAGMRQGDRVLEIGCGTGQLSVPLSECGFDLTAVELGPAMAEVARRNLAPFPAANVHTAAFETWPLPDQPFDHVIAATSFHWLDPDIRLVKAAEALRPGGAIAIISTHHVAGGTSAFFADAQECYLRYDRSTLPGLTLPGPSDIPVAFEHEIAGSGLFEVVGTHDHLWDETYPSAQAYLDVLDTYSGHIALSEDSRRGLYVCLTNLIDSRYGGSITKRFLFRLTVGHRRS
jgi:SAM-dependent methyltransferase